MIDEERTGAASKSWEYLSQTKDEMIAYESRVKAIKDEESAYKHARDKALLIKDRFYFERWVIM